MHDGYSIHGLPLPIAGLMTSKSVETVGKEYMELTRITGELGSLLHAPFMTLSFMGLLVTFSDIIGSQLILLWEKSL